MQTTTNQLIHYFSLAILGLPLAGAMIAGLLGKKIGNVASHTITSLLVGISLILSLIIGKWLLIDNCLPYQGTLYVWGVSGNFEFSAGFLIDKLTAVMMITVNFVSFLVHIYSIGYMRNDPGYQRFFSYISLFTFSMLALVTANNFLQLFFGWEAVGLVSYLLIGFWFHRESANVGSLKAFIVNRVGDAGFIIGVSGILTYFDSLDYATVFSLAPHLANSTITIIPGTHWNLITTLCILLFVGAMGKSAQMPLHVWLPESMEGPTPISALIHAATMVTAGVFMVARLSPLYELSQIALSTILVIGATGALLMGLVGVVQTDIKRVIAYSTLSQLGYMMAGLGASAFSVGIFHLITHASFKALLFLAAGSVIIAMHHEQDMRKMGNLRHYMPITYSAFLIGALSLSAIPPFSGFYSKEAIIEVVHASTIPGAKFAYICVLLGAFVTALYIFRAFFLTFHTDERIAASVKKDLHESPWVIWLPLIILAIPSIILGAVLVGPMVHGSHDLLGNSVYTAPVYNVSAEINTNWHGAIHSIYQAIYTLPLWLSVMGIITAWLSYSVFPQLPIICAKKFSWFYNLLIRKYNFDEFNQIFITRMSINLGKWLFNSFDLKLIDDFFVNGSGRSIEWFSRLFQRSQSGYLYHYAFIMILGLLGLLIWLILG